MHRTRLTGRGGRDHGRRRPFALASEPGLAQTGVPVYGKDKLLGQRQRAHAAAVHAVLQRGHAGERGQVGQRGRHDAHRGDALGQSRSGLQLRADQRLPVQLPRAGLGQPAADVDGGAAAPRSSWSRSRSGSRPSPSATRTSSGSRSSTSRCTTRPTARTRPTRAATATPAATTRERSAAPTAPTAPAGTGSSTPSGWRSSTSPTRS